MATESWIVEGPQIIDLEGIGSLDATILNGRIDVVAHEDPARTDTRVEVHSVSGRSLEVRVEGDRLRIGYEPSIGGWKAFRERFGGYTGRDSADVHVAVPASVYVKVSTVRGDGLVAGARNGARAATVSGSIMTTGTAGALRVDTVSGEVSVSEHTGSITMDSVSGELTATGALDEVSLDSVSGAVTLDTRTTPSQVLVNAVSADVLLRLPDPDAMSYEVRVVTGRLLVDGVEYRGKATTFVRTSQAGEARPVRVTAVSGNVTVLRADDADTAAFYAADTAAANADAVAPDAVAPDAADAARDAGAQEPAAGIPYWNKHPFGTPPAAPGPRDAGADSSAPSDKEVD